MKKPLIINVKCFLYTYSECIVYNCHIQWLGSDSEKILIIGNVGFGGEGW